MGGRLMNDRLEKSRYRDLIIFTGNAHPVLAENIARYLGKKVGSAEVNTFSDGESHIVMGENVRGRDVYVIQPSAQPVNHHLMEMLVMIEALKRSSAERITAVMPYHGYARQDRKVVSGAPITARMVADLASAAGADRILTMDLHAAQIQGFYGIPVDNLYSSPLMMPRIQDEFNGDLVIVSPDAGGTARARAYAKRLDAEVAIIDKRRDLRSGALKRDEMKIVGDVTGKTAIVLDDMIDTGGTLGLAAEALIERGALRVIACATHGIFSGKAVNTIMNSCIERVFTTDTLPSPRMSFPKLEVLSVAQLFGEAIARIHTDDKVSDLFEIKF
jgi:ribose-phosphate pyrophosphokinase